ncbi:MAG: hypothetical protein HQ582_04700, partial [Planctomycetes bacterium]|nr:hypothetical protein [Planctomycetota bacterium]
MKEIPVANFGLLIAYVLPGFVALSGLSLFSPTVMAWLHGVPDGCPTAAGFLYVTLASIGIGMTVNALRWLTLDSLHHRTGVHYPAWDFS